MTKPFSLEELVARLRALMRRSGAQRAATTSVLVVGDLELDEDSHEVTRGGEQITLTATEFELLRFLMRNPRRVLSKAQILDRVWNYDFGGQANVVELYISYLRKKIDAGREPMIHTMRGAGTSSSPRAEPMRHVFASLTSRLVLTAVALVVLVAVLIGAAATAGPATRSSPDQLDDDLHAAAAIRGGRGPEGPGPGGRRPAGEGGIGALGGGPPDCPRRHQRHRLAAASLLGRAGTSRRTSTDEVLDALADVPTDGEVHEVDLAGLGDLPGDRGRDRIDAAPRSPACPTERGRRGGRRR